MKKSNKTKQDMLTAINMFLILSLCRKIASWITRVGIMEIVWK